MATVHSGCLYPTNSLHIFILVFRVSVVSPKLYGMILWEGMITLFECGPLCIGPFACVPYYIVLHRSRLTVGEGDFGLWAH